MDATSQRLLMCRPTYFAVDYAINPWMDPSAPVDADLAVRAVGAAAPDLPRPGPHRRGDRLRCPACPTWSSPPTAAP